MGPGTTQVVEDAAVGPPREALRGERRTEAIAAQTLEIFAVIGGHRLRGVEREAGQAGAEGLGVRGHFFFGNPKLRGRDGSPHRRGRLAACTAVHKARKMLFALKRSCYTDRGLDRKVGVVSAQEGSW